MIHFIQHFPFEKKYIFTIEEKISSAIYDKIVTRKIYSLVYHKSHEKDRCALGSNSSDNSQPQNGQI